MLSIRDHIIVNATPQQIDDGLTLWSGGYLLEGKIKRNAQHGHFYISQNKTLYGIDVRISGQEIYSVCDCKAGRKGEFCEHKIAGLLRIDENSKPVAFPEYPKGRYEKGQYLTDLERPSGTPSSSAPRQRRVNASTPLLLYSEADFEQLMAQRPRRHLGFTYGQNVRKDKNHFIDGRFEFDVQESHYSKYEKVTLRKVDDLWSVSCSCNGKTEPICIHEFVLFTSLVYEWKAKDFLHNPKKISDVRKLVINEFQLDDAEIDEYLLLGFSEGKYFYTPRDKGLLGKTNHGRFSDYLSGIHALPKRLSKDLPRESITEDESQHALIIIPSESGLIGVIAPKLNSKGFISGSVKPKYRLDLPEAWASVKGWLKFLQAYSDFGSRSPFNFYAYSTKTDFAACHDAMLKAKDFLRTVPIYLGKNITKVSKQTVTMLTLSDSFPEIEIDASEDEHCYVLRPFFKDGDIRIEADDPDLIMIQSMTFYQGRLWMHPSLVFGEQLAYLRHIGTVRYLKRMPDEFFALVTQLSAIFRINWDLSVPVKEHLLQVSSARLYLYEEGGHIAFVPKMLYDQDIELSMLQQADPVSVSGTDVVRQIRDRVFEQEHLRQLVEHVPEFEQQLPGGIFYLPVKKVTDKNWFFQFIRWAAEHKIEILGQNALPSLKYSTSVPKINMELSTGIDWFSSTVEIDFDGETVSLARLKKVFSEREEFIPLKDGSLGIIPEAWRRKLERLFRAGTVSGNQIRVSKMQFLIIDELFDQIDEEEIRKEIDEKKQRLSSFESISQAQLPLSVTADLRPYQKEGFNWLCFLREYQFGGCLADDMGLGKTVQILCVIALAAETHSSTSLIVVPRSLLFNWENEILKFCPTLKYKLHHGKDRSQSAEEISGYDVIITTYGTLMRDIESLNTFEFEYAVLDESQAIKNPESKTYKAVRLLNARHRLVMTGTPVENNTFDLYAQLSFVNPGLLGTSKAFMNNYVRPIDLRQDKDRAAELHRIIHPFVLRRTKEQVAPDLPARTEQVLFCEMQPEQRKVYELYRKKYARELDELIESKGINKSQIYILEGLTRLRQICNSPALVSHTYSDVPSEKLELLIEQLANVVTRHKALVFSQFVQMLRTIEERLQAMGIRYYYLDGQTTDRKSIVENFQQTEENCVFLISLKAGGTGLNLTSAEYVFIVDPWWNPAAEKQAIDRTHRIGQTKPVMAYKLICKDSIEEKILLLQSRKKQIADDLIRTEEGMLKSLTKADVVQLFAP